MRKETRENYRRRKIRKRKESTRLIQHNCRPARWDLRVIVGLNAREKAGHAAKNIVRVRNIKRGRPSWGSWSKGKKYLL